MQKRVLILGIFLLAGGAAFLFLQKPAIPQAVPTDREASPNSTGVPPTNIAPLTSPALVFPISEALSRVTKKPFGVNITPQTSPVQPERFSGYHTGVDFEILAGEENIDVPVYAVCGGSLVYKRTVNGYGGVAIENCEMNGEQVNVLYGHLRLSSIARSVGEHLSPGEEFAVLGSGFTPETDGERKHLHLAVHRGAAIELKGYVNTVGELDAWMDPLTVLK